MSALTAVEIDYLLLAEQMKPACREATDSREIAAVLESDGVTDAVARARYAATDVFDLAERLCRETPRQIEPSALVPTPWHATPVLHLLRGVLFGLPALAYLTVADRITGLPSATLLIVSVLLSWATGQGLAYLGHVRLGWGGRRAAAGVLGFGLLAVAVPSVALTVGLGFLVGAPAAVTIVAAAQVAYVLAATVALVLGREWWLLAALVPGVGAAVTGLVRGQSAVLAWVAAASVLAAVAVAISAVRGVRPAVPSWSDLGAAAPTAAFGLLVGALLIFVPAVHTFDPGPDTAVGTGAALAALLPLSLSMGPAEWLLYRYRSATHRALQQAHSLTAFGRRAGIALVGVTLSYLAVLAGLTTVGGLLLLRTGPDADVRPLATAVFVGVALFLALLLMSFGIRGPVVLACLLTLVADAVLLRTAPPETIQAVTAAGLFVVLLVHALAALRRAPLHH